MADERSDGGTAFPSEQGTAPDGTWNQTYEPGMSLRDYFAGQALAGFAASEEIHQGPRSAAGMAYQWADAMLAEREKR